MKSLYEKRFRKLWADLIVRYTRLYTNLLVRGHKSKANSLLKKFNKLIKESDEVKILVLADLKFRKEYGLVKTKAKKRNFDGWKRAIEKAKVKNA